MPAHGCSAQVHAAARAPLAGARRQHSVLPRLWRLLLVLALALPAGLFADTPRPALAAAGDLDPSFGTGGKVVTDLGLSVGGTAMAIQADGKIVALGGGLVRYTPNGSLDPSFGTGGKVIPTEGNLVAVQLQPDGHIVAAGSAGAIVFGVGTVTFALLRYNPDGTLDRGAGVGFTTGVRNLAMAHAVAIQADGKIVVAGYAEIDGIPKFALARFLPDLSSLDPGFGVQGKVITTFPFDAEIQALAIQADGKIVAVGGDVVGNRKHFALARYTPNGSLDATFGSGGQVTTDFPTVDNVEFLAQGMALQADGKIIVAGWARPPSGAVFLLARYTPNGSLDSGFGTDGFAITGFPNSTDSGAYGVAVQADGKIVAAGFASGGFALARYLPSGILDASFGSGGHVTTSFSSGGEARDVALQADGKIVAAGGTTVNGHGAVALARYDAGGVGGLGFGIGPQPSAMLLGWANGAGQDSYFLARSPSAGWLLPANATSYVDPAPAPGPALNCYELFALRSTSVLASSDVLCAQLGLRSPSGAPLDFILQLAETPTARLNWRPAGGQLGYVLLVLPLSGTPRTVTLGAGATSATDQTGGAFTCYLLYPVYATSVGRSDAVCALPGAAQFAVSSATSAESVARAAAEPLAEQTGKAKKRLDKQLRAGDTKVEKVAEQLRTKQQPKGPDDKPSRRDPVVTPSPSPTPTVPGPSGSTDRSRTRP